MLNYLKNCSTNTPIGLLPSIINHNNEAIDAEFSWIYDASLNRLTKSVYAPTGSVKAHFGEFVNLSAEYLTVKNVDSLKNTIYEAVTDIISDEAGSHNVLTERFTDDETEEMYKNTSICHDAGVIAVGENTLLETVTTINDSIYNISTDLVAYKDEVSANIAAVKAQEIADVSELKAADKQLDSSIKEIQKSCTYLPGTNVRIIDNYISTIGYSYKPDDNSLILNDAAVLDAAGNLTANGDIIATVNGEQIALSGCVYHGSNNIDIDEENNISAKGYSVDASENIIAKGDIQFVADGDNVKLSDMAAAISEIHKTESQMLTVISELTDALAALTKRVEALEEAEGDYEEMVIDSNNKLSELTGDTTATTSADYTKEVYDEALNDIETL